MFILPKKTFFCGNGNEKPGLFLEISCTWKNPGNFIRTQEIKKKIFFLII